MPNYQRNLMVGVTMLVGLALLGWMLLRFGGRPATLFAPPRMSVQFHAQRADGIGDGSPIFYRGVSAGRVSRVQISEDQQTVIIFAEVDRHPPLPANVEGVIRSQGLVGTASVITLELLQPQPEGQLVEGQQLPARFVGLDLLPVQFAELAEELRQMAEEIRTARLIHNFAEMAETIQMEISRAGELVESLNSLVADPAVQEDLRQTLKNIRLASESATETAQRLSDFSENLDQMAADATDAVKQAQSVLSRTESHIDHIGTQLSDRIVESAKLLQNVESITHKINQGRGTAGLLVNDPKLYEALVATAQELNLTILDLRRLVEQWEQEGVTVRPR